MTETSSLAPVLKPDDEIQFVATHRPSLEDGQYRLDVRQSVQDSKGTVTGTYAAQRDFWVLGPQFELDHQAAGTVFPPDRSQGSFWTVLPHVILNRSTLPWERSACDSIAEEKDRPPWLALLLFSNDDAVSLRTVTLTDLGVTPQPGQGQHAEDKVQVIDVAWTTLKPLLPATLDEFSYRTHARRVLRHLFTADFMPVAFDMHLLVQNLLATFLAGQGSPLSSQVTVSDLSVDTRWRISDAGNARQYEVAREGISYSAYAVDTEQAVVIGNRLPAPGTRNVVHLVSVENAYRGTMKDTLYTGTTKDDFKFNTAFQNGNVRLVSLRHWDFQCNYDEKTFKGLLEGLNTKPSPASAAFHLPYDKIETDSNGGAARSFLKSGFVPLPHFFRQGDRSVSWYHGPLVPREIRDMELPVLASDKLLLYDTAWGMFDVSYAAAWELGRMLTVSNGRVALALFNWKRRHANVLKAARHLADYGYDFPAGPAADSDAGFPAVVAQWLNDLALLRPVPFNYLVPDDALLPPESLRLFTVDRAWLECLRDGAFSVGRVLEYDLALDTGHLAGQPQIPALSGLLIRSELVAGWPDVQVEAYGATDRLTRVRKDLLSKNVLLCLFEGVIARVDVHLEPQMLHFGLDTPDDVRIGERDPARLEKKLRDPLTGSQSGVVKQTDGPWVDANTRVVDLAKLATRIPVSNAAAFALQMVAGVDLVRFTP